jgi:dCTP deaminase
MVPSQEIREWARNGVISADVPIEEEQIQPASMDLRLGSSVYKLNGVFRPTKKVSEHLQDARFVEEKNEIPSDGFILEKGQTYLIPLQEKLSLDEEVSATLNPKSSTGRIDLSTKIVGEDYPVFDVLPKGYNGQLYCLATPISFPVKIRTGDSLNQIKFAVGNGQLDSLEIKMLHKRLPLVYDWEDNPIYPEKLHVHRSILYLGVDLQAKVKGYVTRRDLDVAPLLDIQKRDHNPEDFFKPIISEGDLFNIHAGRFYLLATSEKFALPAMECNGENGSEAYSATMVPIDANYGDVRTHYAGFFDPGWGSGRNQTKKGKAGTLEVRGMDTNHLCVHGQALCGFEIERMRAFPDKVYGGNSNYSDECRGPQLSKHFKK